MAFVFQTRSIGMGMVFWCVSAFDGHAQPKVVEEINRINSPTVTLAPLRFLASDELMGRATLRPEIHVAARYITEQFRSLGLKEVRGTSDYRQTFDIRTVTPGTSGSFTVNQTSFGLGKDLLYLRGTEEVNVQAPVVFAGYGTEADFNSLDVKGKIVITRLGINDSTSANGMGFVNAKRRLAHERGAVALVERYKTGVVSWETYTGSFSGERVRKDEPVPLPVFLIRDEAGSLESLIQNGSQGKLKIVHEIVRSVPAENVMGWVEGTDPVLKKEYIVLSSHYDHIGISQQPRIEEGKLDSIYNGARDNAIGTTAVIAAARYFAQHPAKRSILFIAYTGEEIGLIGSRHFAEHPAIPLNQLVYNLNIDNASYNDTTMVTVVALGRTSAKSAITKGCAAYGLSAASDSVLRVNLFEGSDNLNLAIKGVPAPTFSLGMRKFDESIRKRYHQLSDEVANLNLNYTMKFIKAFVLSAKYIADNRDQPVWTKGDKYERAWKELYHSDLDD